MNKRTVVVLLGNRLNDDGSISEIQKQRLQLALELEQQFNPDYYVLSGGLANPAAGRTELPARLFPRHSPSGPFLFPWALPLRRSSRGCRRG